MNIPYDQIALLVLSAGSTYCVNHPNPKVVRWGCVCGLLSQPLWLYTGWLSAQWASVILCIPNGLSWCRGVNNNWIKPRRARAEQSQQTP